MRAFVYLLVVCGLTACRDKSDGSTDDSAPQSDDSGTPIDDSDDTGEPSGDDSGPDDSGPDDSGEPGDPVAPGAWTATATTRTAGATAVSFTVPFARGAVPDLSTLRLDVNGENVAFQADVLLQWWDAEGVAEGVRVARVQFDAALLGGDEAGLTVRWGDGASGQAPGSAVVDPNDESIASDVDETVSLATRTIEEIDGAATLVETATWTETQLATREPRVLVVLDPAAWIESGALGATPAVADWPALGLDALSALGQGLSDYTRAAGHMQDYALNQNGVADPADPLQYEFGRCAQFLDAAVLLDDAELLAEGQRLCGWYVEEANLWAASLELWTLNDPVSGLLFHGRDLFEFGMLSGRTDALETTARVADVWISSSFILDYQIGVADGEVWMEQILGAAMEGLWYGYLATGDLAYLDAYEATLATVHTHTTGSDEDIAAMGLAFPAQNCLIHAESQTDEGEDPTRPWCSPWQTATLLDPMLQYRDLTGDARVDELNIAFGRFLRDRGTTYAMEEITYCDSFLEPTTCYEEPAEDADPRMLQPLYAVGIDVAGEVVRSPIEGDFAHCPDVAAMAAAAWAALLRHPELDAGPVGPFASEVESFEALTHELGACGAWAMEHYHRPRRNPSYWTAEALAAGLDDPETFIATYKIGYPDYAAEPLRMPAWWFNTGLLAAPELAAEGVSLPEFSVGWIQPETCADPWISTCP